MEREKPLERDVALSLEDVSLRYGTVAAVQDLDLTVRQGEVVTLLGPSGSGKTTTLYLAAGFRFPDRGRVVLSGRDITREPPHRRNIGLVFQHYALFPHRTVAENIEFPLRMRGVSKSDRIAKVRRALEIVRLEGLEARYPRQLSGGQQQRVALARAFVFDPPLLLMDEPLGALDQNLRQEMQLELIQLQERLQLTIVYVTHDQEEALTLSDRIAVMRAGRIEQLGTPQEIYANPANRFIAAFVGEMNLIDGLVIRTDSGWALEVGEGVHLPVAAPGRDYDANRPVALGVRPERVHFGASSSKAHHPANETVATLEARVSNAIYLGDAWLYQLQATGGLRLRARVPADTPAVRPASGDAVTACWRTSDGQLLQ